jgi:hypothetical protein
LDPTLAVEVEGIVAEEQVSPDPMMSSVVVAESTMQDTFRVVVTLGMPAGDTMERLWIPAVPDRMVAVLWPKALVLENALMVLLRVSLTATLCPETGLLLASLRVTVMIAVLVLSPSRLLGLTEIVEVEEDGAPATTVMDGSVLVNERLLILALRVAADPAVTPVHVLV